MEKRKAYKTRAFRVARAHILLLTGGKESGTDILITAGMRQRRLRLGRLGFGLGQLIVCTLLPGHTTRHDRAGGDPL